MAENERKLERWVTPLGVVREIGTIILVNDNTVRIAIE